VVEHVDAIGAADGGEPVGDDHHGAPGHQRLEAGEEVGFGGGGER
jgi:hypothetical protein